jgi:hypothetical protein
MSLALERSARTRSTTQQRRPCGHVVFVVEMPRPCSCSASHTPAAIFASPDLMRRSHA